jgi:survival-of-motor-neuron-related-splicing factor 30
MDKEDLETYQVQLTQVEIALFADPDNAELASLRSELQELINLTKTVISQSESAAASSSKSTDSSRKTATTQNSFNWSAGDDCLAKYSDGAWYPARINSVAGSAQRRVYSIVFKSYNTTEQVEASSLKSLPPNYTQLPSSAKRKAKEEEEEEKERKRKKNEKKLETRAAKAKEQVQKQASWQKFAKKSEKKGVHIAEYQGRVYSRPPITPSVVVRFSALFYICRFTNSISFSWGYRKR